MDVSDILMALHLTVSCKIMWKARTLTLQHIVHQRVMYYHLWSLEIIC